MTRPRLLLSPLLTELEWVIKPQLEKWAEVATLERKMLLGIKERAERLAA